ncbi:MAG: hypothetical protein AAFX87_23385 [Bacteroidota bacterium]
MKQVLILTFSLLIAFSTHAQTRLFVDQEFAETCHDHELIAVIPFNTTISLRPKQMASLKEGQLDKMQENESLTIQQSMYSWFLKRKQQGSLWVNVQDVGTTNALLAKNNITYANIDKFTAQEIAKILKVDAVVRGTFETNKPMSDGASATLGLLVGFYGSTNRATINMFIHNAEDGKVVVNYNKAVSGSLGSTTDQLINRIMRKTSRRIPYTKPKV